VRAAEIVTTLSGVVLFALLIGFVSNSVEEKMGELRKGRSLVVEDDHTVILGFGEKALRIIEELAEANESRSSTSVVILTSMEKEAVMDTILDRFGAAKLKTTRIVVRHGSSFSASDLENVGVSDARSVIVLSDDGEGDSGGDVRVVKTLLALMRGLAHPLRGHVVVEMTDFDHRDVALAIAGDKVETVIAQAFLARLLVQTARQTGLAQVYSDLLSFRGEEFYLLPVPAELVGKTFKDAWSSVSAGVVSGIAREKRMKGQRFDVQLAPADDLVLGNSDRLLILLPDDSTALNIRPMKIDATLPPRSSEPIVLKPERILLVGWQEDLGEMLLEFDQYVAAGSEATIVTTLPVDECERRLSDAVATLKSLKVRYLQGDPTAKRQLEPACAGGFDAAIVLADQSEARSSEDTDARTLMTLLLLRNFAQERDGMKATRLISEIRNPRTKGLAAVAQVGDFVVSEELVSSFLAQLSETREMADVWADLCDAEGHEIYLKPAWRYCAPGESVSFADVMGRARARGEVALGYKLKAEEGDASKGFGIVLNPPDKARKLTLEQEDRIIVIAETEV
jgi:voltage-gated potassium channel Kch